jgi:hypothetical protein
LHASLANVSTVFLYENVDLSSVDSAPDMTANFILERIKTSRQFCADLEKTVVYAAHFNIEPQVAILNFGATEPCLTNDHATLLFGTPEVYRTSGGLATTYSQAK